MCVCVCVCVCVFVGKPLQTDVPEGAETYLSADLAQHLQAESAHYSKGANYNERDRVTPCAREYERDTFVLTVY